MHTIKGGQYRNQLKKEGILLVDMVLVQFVRRNDDDRFDSFLKKLDPLWLFPKLIKGYNYDIRKIPLSA